MAHLTIREITLEPKKKQTENMLKLNLVLGGCFNSLNRQFNQSGRHNFSRDIRIVISYSIPDFTATGNVYVVLAVRGTCRLI